MWFLLYSLFIFNICICHNNSNDFFFISFNNKKAIENKKKTFERMKEQKSKKKMFKIFFVLSSNSSTCIASQIGWRCMMTMWRLGKMRTRDSLKYLCARSFILGAVKKFMVCPEKFSLILYTKLCFHTHTPSISSQI